jgi:beta-hydroxylase
MMETGKFKSKWERLCALGFDLGLPLAERINRRTARHGNPPVYRTEDFPWCRTLEENWRAIREELDVVLAERERLPAFQEISPEQIAITTDDKWKVLMFHAYGLKVEHNCRKCPKTAELCERIPGMKTAFFSILAPGKHIPPHCGPYNGVLRFHLGLIVPEPNADCKIAVDGEIHHWQEGRGLVFDDSFPHQVWNDTPGQRVVLFVDFVRPVVFPFSLFNRLMIGFMKQSPFIQGADRKLREWERKTPPAAA